MRAGGRTDTTRQKSKTKVPERCRGHTNMSFKMTPIWLNAFVISSFVTLRMLGKIVFTIPFKPMILCVIYSHKYVSAIPEIFLCFGNPLNLLYE